MTVLAGVEVVLQPDNVADGRRTCYYPFQGADYRYCISNRLPYWKFVRCTATSAGTFILPYRTMRLSSALISGYNETSHFRIHTNFLNHRSPTDTREQFPERGVSGRKWDSIHYYTTINQSKH